jgi:hypothetical protein
MRLMDEKPVTRSEMLDALADVATKTEMREAFAEMRAEMREGFATKTEMREGFAAIRSEMQEGFAAAKLDMRETIAESVRDSQTELLKAFLSYQENNDLRIRTVEAKLSNVDAGLSQRVNNMERRLWEIEKKLLLDPPAA